MPDYATAVPADAEAVASVRMAKILKESGITNSIVFRLMNAGSSSLLTLLSDPATAGISAAQPAYVFKRHDLLGVSMEVDDESLLEAAVSAMTKNGITTTPRQREGLTWSTLLGEMRMVWSDNTLLIAAALDGSVDDRMLLSLMRQKADESFAATQGYTHLTDMDGTDIALYANAAMLPDEARESIKPMMPAGAKYSEVELTASLQMAAGKATARMQMYSTNPKIQDAIDSKYAALKPIGSDMMNRIPRGTSMWLLAGADGSQLLDVLKSIPGMKERLLAIGMGIDIEQMLRTVDGDILLTWQQDQAMAYAQVANTDFMADVDYWKQSAKDYGMSITDVATNHYHIHATDLDAYMATDDNILYLGLTPYTPLQTQGTNAFAADMKGKNLFIMADGAVLSPEVSSITLSSAQSGEVEVNLNLKNTKQNVLALLIALLTGK